MKPGSAGSARFDSLQIGFVTLAGDALYVGFAFRGWRGGKADPKKTVGANRSRQVAAEELTAFVYLLLVEDDETLGDMVRRGLEATGYRVLWEQDGDAAYDRACSGAYDALVLDLMLPGLDGLALVRSLRAAGVRTPVLCLTALAAVDDKVAGLEAGADDYLTKPFAFDELLARLRALLRRPRDVVVADLLTAGSLHLSPADRQVTVRGRRLEVPGREFDLLEYLIRNRGRTLPRDLVLDRIWGGAASPRANVVDVTISRLRRRLAAAGWEGRIVAVPGLGYRLADVEEGRAR